MRLFQKVVFVFLLFGVIQVPHLYSRQQFKEIKKTRKISELDLKTLRLFKREFSSKKAGSSRKQLEQRMYSLLIRHGVSRKDCHQIVQFLAKKIKEDNPAKFQDVFCAEVDKAKNAQNKASSQASKALGFSGKGPSPQASSAAVGARAPQNTKPEPKEGNPVAPPPPPDSKKTFLKPTTPPSPLFAEKKTSKKRSIDDASLPGSAVKFYKGELRTPSGHSFDDIMKWSNEELEAHHDYIQFLFPMKVASQAQPGTKIRLHPEDIRQFESDPFLRQRVEQAFAKMCAFYGFKWVSFNLHYEHPHFVRRGWYYPKADNFKERIRVWLTPGNHNHLRLTRIMNSLHDMHMIDHSESLGRCLFHHIILVPEYKKNISKDTLCNHWSKAMHSTEEELFN